MNNQHPKIKFTFEKESNNALPFLDLLISRTQCDGIRFSIYRKSTHTNRFITSDSHHSGSHQSAAFHSMIHRLINIPMDRVDYDTELAHIKNIALLNGYPESFVNKILKRHIQTKLISNLTSLEPERKQLRRISVPFYPQITNILSKTLRKHEIQLVPVSSTTLKNSICNYKDKIDDLHQSGIYIERCNDCEFIYIGQTRRRLIDRHKQHKNHTTKGSIHLSAVAQHMIVHNHSFDETNFEKLKTVNKTSLLDAYESMYIATSTNNLMNREDAPINSRLYTLIKRKKL